MRSLMVNVLGEDYITVRRVEGAQAAAGSSCATGCATRCCRRSRRWRWRSATVVSGAVLVEAIFNYPGLGGLLFASILGKDIFVINGIVFVLIITLAVAVFVIDLIIPVLDPRIRRHA